MKWSSGSSCTAAIVKRECPLWVKSRHRGTSDQCPLYPQKRTLIERVGMSALCQKRTSLNDRVCPGDESRWNRDSKFFGCFLVIISSNVVGCCIGRSEGLAPFKILSI